MGSGNSQSPEDAPRRAAVTLESAWQVAKDLATKFAKSEPHYTSGAYQEAHLRTDFLNKLFIALGWDVLHDHEHDPYRQEVKIERSDQRALGRADYAFSLAPSYQRVRFLLEAKRPQADILTPDNCFQAIRYSWPLGLPLVVLSDFKSIHILDSRFKPNINSAVSRVVRTWDYHEFHDAETFAQIYWLLSREAVLDGSLERFVERFLPNEHLAARQYSLFPADQRDFDDDFLYRLDEWRAQLASAFKAARTDLTGEQLTEVVQKAIDRLVFIRFLEDKSIEPDQIISTFGTSKRTAWRDFVASSQRLDAVYNGVVFKPHPVLDSLEFNPSSSVFMSVCDELTDEHSPYHFGSIPVEILGRIYERFLGKVVEIERGRAKIVDKAEVRRAGGVFYTPSYIVDYMVESALAPKVRQAKSIDALLNLRLIDTSCGSGSFLIAAFAYLMSAALTFHRSGKGFVKQGRYEVRDGEGHLTMAFKREILTKCIFGVDIDPQAVEVAQLSLYLKLMEDETTHSARNQQLEMGAALLPSLAANIVEGNSLITLDEELFNADKLRDTKSLDFHLTFPRAFDQGGFDLVIGNPPYIKEPTNRSAFDHVRGSPYYEGKMDIWYMFASRGLDWLKTGTGTLALIATNNWTTNAGARKLRRKIICEATIEQLVDFADFKVFRDAGIQTMILIARKDRKALKYSFDYRKILAARPTLDDARSMLERRETTAVVYLTPEMARSDAQGAPLTFSDDAASLLLGKIEARANFTLNGSGELAQGIVPNPDVVSARSIDLIPPARRHQERISVGDGVFVVSHRTFPNPTRAERALLKPLVEPTDVSRYLVTRPSQKWLIYSVRNKMRDDTPPGRILRHLQKYREIMEARRETQNGRLETHHLHWPRSEKFFVAGPKILAVRKCTVPTFAYTEEDAYVMMAFNVIKSDRINLKYLTAILNSEVIRFWLKHRGKMQGNNFQVDSEPLLALPIHAADRVEQDRIATLVDRVIERTQLVETASTLAEMERAQRLLNQSEEAVQAAVANLYLLSRSDRQAMAPAM